VDFIEYYIQLIKTILMKISENPDNRLLIRMFCNTKYPNFPLLTYISILAADTNELIGVTAQQCILILVDMINENKMYSIYLCEPPMLTFVARLATEFIKPNSDREGICKYLADLMYEMKSSEVPLMLISNILCNVIIVSSLPMKISIALEFVERFCKCVEIRILEYQEIDRNSYYRQRNEKEKESTHTRKSSSDNLVIICSTFYRVLIKYLSNMFINGIYLAATIQFTLPSSDPCPAFPLKVTYPSAQLLFKIL
jgi:hypothetical protein